jgi:hypothetical protein
MTSDAHNLCPTHDAHAKKCVVAGYNPSSNIKTITNKKQLDKKEDILESSTQE